MKTKLEIFKELAIAAAVRELNIPRPVENSIGNWTTYSELVSLTNQVAWLTDQAKNRDVE